MVAQSRLDEDPRLRTLWAGYAFAKDFREERGHAYMLDDQTFTERQQVTSQPGTCMNCHASLYVPYKKLGGGDIVKGFEKLNQMPYFDARKLVNHPVACIDCHDSQTMALRVTRPAFMEGMRALKAAQGVQDYDVNTMATRQEMRAFVCGQCHVEYYFKGPEKRLTYPWSKGLKVDEILQYYDENPHDDWTHAESGAKVLKAQHPEFEMWNQGIHARSGVACADCHMPYMRVGAHEDQRPSRAQPRAEHQQRVPDLSQVAGRGAAGAHRDHPGARLRPAQPGDGGGRRADHRPEGGPRTRCIGCRARPAAPTAAPGAVHAGLRRSGELHRLPCARRRPSGSWPSRSITPVRVSSRCAASTCRA